MKRTIIKIDQEKCTGCGLCVPACAEGALQIIDGKARLVSEKFCDGLGACLGKCPTGALVVETREAEEFDEEAAKAQGKTSHISEDAGPSVQVIALPSGSKSEAVTLSQWPIQLLLVPSNAPFLKGADLVIAADCVAFAYPSFHVNFLRGRKLIIGCPKLDDVQFYRKKLEAIFKESQPQSITVVNMEIPCCSGLHKVVKEALVSASLNIPLKQEIIGIRGNRIRTYRI
jgi:NAD-dependent dihydropyrimidine dehydrogenase PreA subunit